MIEIPVRLDNKFRHAYPMTPKGVSLARTFAGRTTIDDDMVEGLYKMGYKVVDRTPRTKFNYTGYGRIRKKEE